MALVVILVASFMVGIFATNSEAKPWHCEFDRCRYTICEPGDKFYYECCPRFMNGECLYICVKAGEC